MCVGAIYADTGRRSYMVYSMNVFKNKKRWQNK